MHAITIIVFSVSTRCRWVVQVWDVSCQRVLTQIRIDAYLKVKATHQRRNEPYQNNDQDDSEEINDEESEEEEDDMKDETEEEQSDEGDDVDLSLSC